VVAARRLVVDNWPTICYTLRMSNQPTPAVLNADGTIAIRDFAALDLAGLTPAQRAACQRLRPQSHPEHGVVVAAQTTKGQNVIVRVATRPFLAALVAPLIEGQLAAKAAQQEAMAAAAQTRAAAIAACPADHVAAEQLWSNGDLCAAEYRVIGGEYAGVQLLESDMLTDHGCGVYYVSAAAVAKKQADQARVTARKQADQARVTARKSVVQAEAARTGQPQLWDSELVNESEGYVSIDTYLDGAGIFSQKTRVIG
jgi:hypothetical protein